ncbi:MAG: hypothetical protein JSV86_12905 [Gemmatimonadota bacterium]|nr:MAG: hypothetical protein JSV86_12905 [Gemmatimonadota bacterium]
MLKPIIPTETIDEAEFRAEIKRVREDAARRINEANARVPYATLAKIDDAKSKLRHLYRAAAESTDGIATLIVSGLDDILRDLDRAKETPAD